MPVWMQVAEAVDRDALGGDTVGVGVCSTRGDSDRERELVQVSVEGVGVTAWDHVPLGDVLSDRALPLGVTEGGERVGEPVLRGVMEGEKRRVQEWVQPGEMLGGLSVALYVLRVGDKLPAVGSVERVEVAMPECVKEMVGVMLAVGVVSDGLHDGDWKDVREGGVSEEERVGVNVTTTMERVK